MGKRTGKASRDGTGAPKPWQLVLGGKPKRSEKKKADSRKELVARLERVRNGLYSLYADLSYFETGPPDHRELLRERLNWPDVGHITSLARALAEEDRFCDWVRFNGYGGLRPRAGPAERSA